MAVRLGLRFQAAQRELLKSVVDFKSRQPRVRPNPPRQNRQEGTGNKLDSELIPDLFLLKLHLHRLPDAIANLVMD